MYLRIELHHLEKTTSGYSRVFGAREFVWHSVYDTKNHIDIYIYIRHLELEVLKPIRCKLGILKPISTSFIWRLVYHTKIHRKSAENWRVFARSAARELAGVQL